MRGKGIIETDFGRLRISRSAGKNTIIVEVEVGGTYVRQVLRGDKIDLLREQVTRACDSVIRDGGRNWSVAVGRM